MNFSVVIPLYNKERHIKRAIYSVLKQTYENFELLVINDGSTDNSLKKVKEIHDSRIRIIEQNNQGVSVARNTGIEQASYYYIAFLDADDVWKPKFLSTIKEMIQNYPHAGVYATLYELVLKSGEVVPRNVKGLEPGQTGTVNYFQESVERPILSSSAVVIPKNVFKKIGRFPVGIAYGEDSDMWIRIALNYPVVISNKIYTTYFLNADNRSDNEPREYYKNSISYADKVLERERGRGNITVEFEEYMINKIITKARYLINNGQRLEARNLLKKYKHTKNHKNRWMKTYLLSYKVIIFANYLRSRIK